MASYPRVTIFSKPDCCLCDEAKTNLLAVREDVPFVLEEVDVSQDSRLLDEYGQEIPVIFIEGRKAFKFRVDPKALKRKLARLSRG